MTRFNIASAASYLLASRLQIATEQTAFKQTISAQYASQVSFTMMEAQQ